MKKAILFVLAICITIIVGCSADEDILPLTNGDNMPVELNIGTYITDVENEFLESITIVNVDGHIEYTLIRPNEISKGSIPPHGTPKFEDSKVIFDYFGEELKFEIENDKLVLCEDFFTLERATVFSLRP